MKSEYVEWNIYKNYAHSLNVTFEACKTMVLNSLCQTPTETGNKLSFGGLQCTTNEKVNNATR